MKKTKDEVKLTCDNPACGKSFWRDRYYLKNFRHHYCSTYCRDKTRRGPIAGSMFRMVVRK